MRGVSDDGAAAVDDDVDADVDADVDDAVLMTFFPTAYRSTTCSTTVQ